MKVGLESGVWATTDSERKERRMTVLIETMKELVDPQRNYEPERFVLKTR